MGLLDHQMLQLIKGVGKTPGDTFSEEEDPIVINLLDRDSGFSLDLDGGWEPNIPSMKSGGTWADSPISDGRTLISGQNTNVVETIRLHVSSKTTAVYSAKFAALQRMAQDARKFWDTSYQKEPVYLAWWASCAPGPQYSLIYNIDMDVVFEDSEAAQVTITLSIEREYRWRGHVWPGASPKMWTKFIQGQQFNANNAYLVPNSKGNDHFASASIKNATVRSTPLFNAITAQNFIDIPGENIPGDLDALVAIWATGTDPIIDMDSVIISRWTGKNFATLDGGGVPALRYSSFTLGAGVLTGYGTDTSAAADTGSLHDLRSTTTFATSTSLVARLFFNSSNSNTRVPLYAGGFALFLRARLSAAGTVGLRAGIDTGDANLIYGETQQLTDVGGGGTGNSTYWGWVYLGQFRLPTYDAAIGSDPDGTGIDEAEFFEVIIEASRVSGTPSLYVSDLIFVPIDECAAEITILGGVWTTGVLLFDNTGYMGHGRPFELAFRTTSGLSVSSKLNPARIQGQGLTLKPQIDNRIYFLQLDDVNKRSIVDIDFDVGLNIVPCWSGIRDV